ncbi:cytochrome P450 2J4-like [Pyxicephalus adspersus]|uniref:cytochrome P450 2J4-like n=1 Tax=Pyxicephalus adspersus TaxID=30357 RepID=UPI003B59B236
MDIITLLVVGFALLLLLQWKLSRPKGFPPGPIALPLVGNLLQIDFTNPLKDLKAFSKVYGPMFSIYLGFTPAVVIRELKHVKEILVNKGVDFADRPQNRLIQLISGGRGLIFAGYGSSWKEHRRFTLSTLRNFGLGKKSMEQRICEEAAFLIDEMKKNKGSLYDPHFVLGNAASNIICSIVFGRRYNYDNPTFRDLLNLVHEHTKRTSGFWAQLFNAFGFIKHLPLPHQKVIRNIKVIFGFLRNVLEEHKRTRVPNQPRDYIDCYLDEVDKEKQDGYKSSFDDENLLTCMLDLFIAGRETTSSSLEWTLLYMMIYSDVQEKCRTEMDTVRGDRDHLDYEDRVRMPYTQAVLREVQRFASILPLGVAHSPIKDVQLNGYTIPKGTFIITDLSSVHYDESSWKYPYEFNPDHFLNKDGELIKTESFLPLSAGPRVCLGENMAQIEIFLFFTTMLTHFEFHCADPKSPPDLTPVFGVSQTPRCFKMRLVHRT